MKRGYFYNKVRNNLFILLMLIFRNFDTKPARDVMSKFVMKTVVETAEEEDEIGVSGFVITEPNVIALIEDYMGISYLHIELRHIMGNEVFVYWIYIIKSLERQVFWKK